MASTQTAKSRSTTRKAPPTSPKAAAKPAPVKKKTAAKPSAPVTDTAQWQQKVAAAAYLRAEARGFIGGSPEQDWFEAEAELMTALGSAKAV